MFDSPSGGRRGARCYGSLVRIPASPTAVKHSAIATDTARRLQRGAQGDG